jgi:hypothetical protein
LTGRIDFVDPRSAGELVLQCPTKSFDVGEFHGQCTYQDEAKCNRSDRGADGKLKDEANGEGTVEVKPIASEVDS